MTNFVTDTPLTIPQHVMARKVGAQSVLLNVESGYYFGLDELGARVWEMLAAGRSARQVCEELAPAYDVPRAQFEHDIFELVSELLRANLLTQNSG